MEEPSHSKRNVANLENANKTYLSDTIALDGSDQEKFKYVDFMSN